MVMHNIILVRYGELALKKGNRAKFENRLVENIRDCLKSNKIGFNRIIRKRGRIYVDTGSECTKLAKVFGITSYSHAAKLEFNIDRIKETISDSLSKRKFGTFRITAHRIDKEVEMTSNQMNNVFGQYVIDKFKKRVSLKDYDIDIGIEVYGQVAYVYIDKVEGPKGLPYGINGEVYALIEDEKSKLAAWLMMKRGLRIYPVSFEPQDISILKKYHYGFSPMKLLRIASVSKLPRMDIKAIVVGQTLDEISGLDTEMMILRPLVGLSKEEIAQKIKTL